MLIATCNLQAGQPVSRAIIDVLAASGATPVSESAWLVPTLDSPLELMDALAPHVQSASDRLFVATLERSNCEWLNPLCGDALLKSVVEGESPAQLDGDSQEDAAGDPNPIEAEVAPV